MSLPAFLKLLSGQEMPEGWLAGIIDMDGRFVARVPNQDDKIGQLASEGWRAVQGREGVFEFASLEGDTVVQGNALSKASGWAIGIAVRKSALMAGAWSTVRWTVLSGCGLLLVSLLLAGLIARSITEPLVVLRKNADALVDGSTPDFRPGAPEIAELWKSLERAIEESQSFANAASTGQRSPGGYSHVVHGRNCQQRSQQQYHQLERQCRAHVRLLVRGNGRSPDP